MRMRLYLPFQNQRTDPERAYMFVKNPRIDADVALLDGAFPSVQPDGSELAHSQIEAVLRTPRKSSRYKQVLRRWRRQLLQEHGVYLDGILAHGRGFICLTPDEMVRFGNRTVREAGRKVRKAIVVASTPDDESLTPFSRRYRGVLVMAAEKIARENAHALRDITRALAPQKQMPRATP